MGEQLLITVKEAAHRLSLSKSQVYVMLDRGELKGVRAGKSRRIFPESLVAWIDKQRQAES